jgi:hypothetical protein
MASLNHLLRVCGVNVRESAKELTSSHVNTFIIKNWMTPNADLKVILGGNF